MKNKSITILNLESYLANNKYRKYLHKKRKLVVPTNSEVTGNGEDIYLKYRNIKNSIQFVNDAEILWDDNSSSVLLSLNSEIISQIKCNAADLNDVWVVFEGVNNIISITFYFVDKNANVYEDLGVDLSRLEQFDIPPINEHCIVSDTMLSFFNQYLLNRDPQLFSKQIKTFVNHPHLLTFIFNDIQVLGDKEQTRFLDTLYKLADTVRNQLEKKGYIKRIEKNHNDLWGHYVGEKITYIDGGMSRVVSLPRSQPMGIRIGEYTVMPGESNLEKREKFNLFNTTVSEVINDLTLVNFDHEPDEIVRRAEAARYILEPMIGMQARDENNSRLVFIHGPLQNKFEMYDENQPHVIPGVAKVFLDKKGIDKEEIFDLVKGIPSKSKKWNSPIPIYAYLMHKVNRSQTPLIGVVERSPGNPIIRFLVNWMREEHLVTQSVAGRIKQLLKKYEINDDRIFGAMLYEGEYINLVKIIKNDPTRAHVDWADVINNMPEVWASIIKCSEMKFPFRIEFNRKYGGDELHSIMKLIYHSSVLLPEYSFPVGLDIVDKYAKVPDWLSRGVSQHVAVRAYLLCLQEGDSRKLQLIRNLLGKSQRDFFFRSKAGE